MRVACIDYYRGSALLSDMLENMARMVGEQCLLRTEPEETAFGWTFYVLSLNKDVVRRFSGLPGIDILKERGSTLDEKFAAWLNHQLKHRLPGMQVRLLSELSDDSRFGSF